MRLHIRASMCGLAVVLAACAKGSSSDPGSLDPGETPAAPASLEAGALADPDAAPLAQVPADATAPVDAGAGDAATDTNVADAPRDAAPAIDSAPPPAVGDCVGTTSAQLGLGYDDACDQHFQASFPFSGANDCTPGANGCATLHGGGYTFCCFAPAAGSPCSQDYKGKPQCIPE